MLLGHKSVAAASDPIIEGRAKLLIGYGLVEPVDGIFQPGNLEPNDLGPHRGDPADLCRVDVLAHHSGVLSTM
jgi:hypothetical protein